MVQIIDTNLCINNDICRCSFIFDSKSLNYIITHYLFCTSLYLLFVHIVLLIDKTYEHLKILQCVSNLSCAYNSAGRVVDWMIWCGKCLLWDDISSSIHKIVHITIVLWIGIGMVLNKGILVMRKKNFKLWTVQVFQFSYPYRDAFNCIYLYLYGKTCWNPNVTQDKVSIKLVISSYLLLYNPFFSHNLFQNISFSIQNSKHFLCTFIGPWLLPIYVVGLVTKMLQCKSNT